MRASISGTANGGPTRIRSPTSRTTGLPHDRCGDAEYELRGADRAQYGKKLLAKLSIRLTENGVSRAEERELRRYRQFYHTYPQIREADSRIAKTSRIFDKEPIGLDPGVGDSRIRRYRKGTDHDLVEYALAGMDNKLFVSKYQLHLPERAQLRRELERSIKESS